MTMGSRIVVKKDGIIQQVDTPQNIYEHPKNIFVAGFIGSPQMNFIDIKVLQKSDKVVGLLGEIEESYCSKLKAIGIEAQKDLLSLGERKEFRGIYTSIIDDRV